MAKHKYAVIVAVIAAIATATLLVAGCGGGGGAAPANVGSVTGRIVELVSGVGVEGMTVTIGGQEDDSGADGYFTVTGVTPGTWQINVTPTAFYVPVGELPTVAVSAGVTTPLGDDILVTNPGNVPPPPPGG